MCVLDWINLVYAQILRVNSPAVLVSPIKCNSRGLTLAKIS